MCPASLLSYSQKHLKGSDAMKIILDDRRPLPEDSREYNCLRTYEECALLLRNFHTISYISLDYDLGEGETGLSVLKYMVECGNDVKHINIHSTHPTGVPKMLEYAKKNFPGAELTQNRL